MTKVPSSGLADQRLRPRGSSQGGVRQYNERVVLEAVRLHAALPAAEIARLTGLTAQTVSHITKRLLDDGLLKKGEPQRGRVGQPSVPLSLHADGAYSIGIHVGRRRLDVVLLDLAGQVRQRHAADYPHADPAELLPLLRERLGQLRRKLGGVAFARVQGIGIAAPLSPGGWQQLLDMPDAVAARWRATDLAAEVSGMADLPVTLVKDTAAACVAELVAGRGRSVKSFLYVFVDTFVGGGLVLDSRLRPGPAGNAGAVGSLPLFMPQAGDAAPPPQLLSVASLLPLARAWLTAGLADDAAADARALQPPWLPHTQAWLASAALAIAQAVHTAACLLDLDGCIVDGNLAPALRDALVVEVAAASHRYDWEGVSRPQLAAGSIGSDARALGGALLPLHAAFAPDHDLFLKAPA